MKNLAGSRDDAAYPLELAHAENELVESRRAACGIPPTDGRVGVGLSGGGIRSATFCLGLFQALSKARESGPPGELLGRIDYLSTVSGGGYFGSFFGRLFTRSHVEGVADVAQVLQGAERPQKGQTTFRFLRDNGRYLAPRGSGDLLALIAVTLRNWLAVQTVLMLFVLMAFVLLQYADIRLRGAVAGSPVGPVAWSPWFIGLVPLVLLWALPTAWAYWVIGLPMSKRQLFRRSDVVVLLLLGFAWARGWFPTPLEPGAWPPITYAVAALAATTIATTIWSLLGNPRGALNWLGIMLGIVDMETAVADTSLARNRLTRWLKKALVAIVVVAVVAFVDSLGATIYALFKAEGGFTNLTAAIAGLLAAFGGVATFGRQLLVLLGGEGSKVGPRVPKSIISWLVALLVLGAWLISLNAVSHAIAWRAEKPAFADSLVRTEAVRIADAEAIEVTAGAAGRQVVRPLEERAQSAAAAAERDAPFTGRVLLLLLVLVVVLGNTRSFLNLSSLHTFYSQRLTRAYLGASNRKRLDNDDSHVTEVIGGDDLPSDQYWNWPKPPRAEGAIKAIRQFVVRNVQAVQAYFTRKSPEEPKPAATTPRSVTGKGGPLHLVNVTINETLDNRTGVQRQDRKGVPLAVGPGGLSVGVRHHLIADATAGFVARPAEGHAVFQGDLLGTAPEVMTLGRWVSISGAAFSSALGARTTVPLALLATFANVRLGYWWDSGLGKGWQGPWLPVYRGLLSECIARLRGTGIRLWNLSDGGHFENLGGYELIRRRLPLIVLIDAEADPDFEFPGLAELIRKARLDFGAEIRFLDEREVQQDPNVASRAEFTSLQRLRRGEWNEGEDGRATVLSDAANRRSYSRAHTAVAKVTYRDGRRGWLVYVKASLTGDEPVDVLQYHAKHPDFPHETTADQFFDEAQWESYRRLGEHIGERVLSQAVFDLANVPP